MSVASLDRSGERRWFVTEEAVAANRPTWNFSGVSVDVRDGQCEVSVALYCDDPLAGDRRSLIERSRPLCGCSFELFEADLAAITAAPQLRSLPLFAVPEPDGSPASRASAPGSLPQAVSTTCRQGDVPPLAVEAESWQDMGVVTLALSVAAPDKYEAMVPVEQLPLAPAERARWSTQDALERLSNISRGKREDVRRLATHLERMQRTLDVLDRRCKDLTAERSRRLEESSVCERRLKDLREPDLTDLDIELMLSLPGGLAKLEHAFVSAEHRWRRARAGVIAQWQDFEKCKREVEASAPLRHSLRALQDVGREQQTLLAAARERFKEVQEARRTMHQRERRVRQLQQQLEELASRRELEGSAVEVELLFSKEHTERVELREAGKRLELRAVARQRREHERELRGEPSREDMARSLAEHSTEVLHVLGEIQRLQGLLSGAGRTARAEAAARDAAAACASTRSEASAHEEAAALAELRCEELGRRADALQAEHQTRAMTFGRELAGLKVRLADGEARAQSLEVALSGHARKP